jgi:uncharacterized protein (DUF2336 family)
MTHLGLARAGSASLPKLNYEQARAILEQGSAADQFELAQHGDAPPEALYFLAERGDARVRLAVAANAQTPIAADALLAVDTDEDVRKRLAERIGRVMPHLEPSARAQARELALVILERLARDASVRVRAALVEEIKADARFPRDLANLLARDAQPDVQLPILRFSPQLTDADLLDLLRATHVRAAFEAVAQRGSVSQPISACIIERGGQSAVAALLNNPNAQIREDTLDAILNDAPTVVDWHEPLILRANLSTDALRRIAGFVSQSLVERLIKTHALPPGVAATLAVRAADRVTDAGPPEPPEADALSQAEALVSAGEPTDAWVREHLKQTRRAVVVAALGLKADISPDAAARICGSRNGRAVAALAWKAGLSAASALVLQQDLANTPAALQLAPAGTGYALSADEMDWLLSTFLTG